MKTVITIAAIALTAAPAFADLDVKRTNVPAASGAVPGFYVQGKGYFVEEASADRATVAATVVPASVDIKDMGEVAEWLASQGITDISFCIQTADTVISAVTTEVSPGVFVTEDVATRESIPAYRQRWSATGC